MRNKLLGIANVIFGLTGVFFNYYSFSAQKSVSIMQDEMFVHNDSLLVVLLPYIFAVSLLYMLYAVYFGVKLLFSKENQDSLYKKGSINLIITGVLLVLDITLSKFVIISSLYTITQSL